ncbi:MAG: hypothetical protein K6F92_08690 [Lachnospiraceae bacterium]|nr:hypothetical protein [Lachnospiraceae bacterium]
MMRRTKSKLCALLCGAFLIGCSTSDNVADTDTTVESGPTDAQSSVSESESAFSLESSASESESAFPEETTGAQSSKTGVLDYALAHDFISVMYDGDEDYEHMAYTGGNQSWFYNDQTGEGYYTLQEQGCGLMAVADTLIYMSLHHENLAGLTDVRPDENGVIDYETYSDYILGMYAMDDVFVFDEMFGGIMGITLDDAVRKCASMRDCSLTASWNKPDKDAPERFTIDDAKYFLEDCGLEEDDLEDFTKRTNTIISMLENDIPVPMSIGPGRYVNFRQDDLEFPVTTHYYIVGGMHLDYDNKTITLDIYSWGKNYTVDYLEHTLAVYPDASSFSSYILIKNRG